MYESPWGGSISERYWALHQVPMSMVFFSDSGTRVMPVRDGNPPAIASLWGKILSRARAYAWAETEDDLSFPRWPRSLYSSLGSNSNTFVRYVMATSGIGFPEMSTGPHSGSSSPSQNHITGVDFYATAKPWVHLGSEPMPSFPPPP